MLSGITVCENMAKSQKLGASVPTVTKSLSAPELISKALDMPVETVEQLRTDNDFAILVFEKTWEQRPVINIWNWFPSSILKNYVVFRKLVVKVLCFTFDVVNKHSLPVWLPDGRAEYAMLLKRIASEDVLCIDDMICRLVPLELFRNYDIGKYAFELNIPYLCYPFLMRALEGSLDYVKSKDAASTRMPCNFCKYAIDLDKNWSGFEDDSWTYLVAGVSSPATFVRAGRKCVLDNANVVERGATYTAEWLVACNVPLTAELLRCALKSWRNDFIKYIEPIAKKFDIVSLLKSDTSLAMSAIRLDPRLTSLVGADDFSDDVAKQAMLASIFSYKYLSEAYRSREDVMEEALALEPYRNIEAVPERVGLLGERFVQLVIDSKCFPGRAIGIEENGSIELENDAVWGACVKKFDPQCLMRNSKLCLAAVETVAQFASILPNSLDVITTLRVVRANKRAFRFLPVATRIGRCLARAALQESIENALFVPDRTVIDSAMILDILLSCNDIEHSVSKMKKYLSPWIFDAMDNDIRLRAAFAEDVTTLTRVLNVALSLPCVENRQIDRLCMCLNIASCKFDGKLKPNVDQMRATCVDSAINESQKRIFRIHAESVSAHRCVKCGTTDNETFDSEAYSYCASCIDNESKVHGSEQFALEKPNFSSEELEVGHNNDMLYDGFNEVISKIKYGEH
jgi:hypothetical protein